MKSGNISVRFHILFSHTALQSINSIAKPVFYLCFFLRMIFRIFFYNWMHGETSMMHWEGWGETEEKLNLPLHFHFHACI